MIRAATPDDLPGLVAMGERFRASTPYREHLTNNPDQMARLAAHLTAAGSVLVAERDGRLVGMFGYVVFSHFLSGELVAGEVFWWVEPESRGDGVKLLREAEKRAKLAGARRMQMIAPNDRVASLYERIGYGFVEASYQKNL